MREGRRFALGFLLLVTLALLGLSNVPLVYADDADVVEASSEGEGSAEAVVDATGDVQVDEPEPPKEEEDDGAAAAAAAEAEAAAARAAEAEAAAAKAAAEASAVADETEKSGDVASSTKSKAMAFVDKAKAVTPEQMKKFAAGAIGVWGVAAGAGWVMNNLGGAEE